MKFKKIFVSIITMLVLVQTVLAINLAITPPQNWHTQVENEGCDVGTTTTQFTITNNGGGGLLCWYYTNKDPTKKKLISSCLSPGVTGYFDVSIPMPTSGGSDVVSVQLECFDFYSIWDGDKCNESYSYSQAMANKYSCAAAVGNTFCSNEISLRYFDTTCNFPEFSITASKTSVSLYSGQSETITITVNNQGGESIICDYGLSTISGYGSKSFQKIVSAPSTGSGSKTESAEVTCTSSSGLSVPKSITITVNYQADPCISALENARNSISDASKEIIGAESKIKEATNIGADVATATSYLNQANSYLSTAQTKLSTAQSSCAGDKTSGVSQANEAKTAASQAKTNAVNAKNTAEKLIEEFTKKKKEASNKISQASSKMDDVNVMIQKTESMIYNATQIGWDTIKYESAVKSARAKIDLAKTYYSEASSALNQNNVNLAIQKATSALTYATEGYNLIDPLYRDLDTTLIKMGVVVSAVLQATTEISQMNNILTKMDYVVISTEKWGVSLVETKGVLSTAKTNVDSAEDLLSQAKNNLQAGAGIDDATTINIANEARNKAANSRNRLDTMTHTISLSVQEALEKAYNSINTKIKEAESEVVSAQNTYGATPDYIISAQNNLANARNSLKQSASYIQSVKSAPGLTELLEEADKSFKALNSAEEKTTLSIKEAKAAKMGLVKKVAIGAAGIAAATGGGFLYYRSRKKKGKKKKGKKKTKKEKKKKGGKKK